MYLDQNKMITEKTLQKFYVIKSYTKVIMVSTFFKAIMQNIIFLN